LPDSGVSVEDLRAEALRSLESVAEGDALDEVTAALIGLAVRVSVTVLDMEGARIFAERALDAGATGPQISETLVLVSGLGVHTLMEGSAPMADLLRERGDAELSAPLDDRRVELWERCVGEDPYWNQVEAVSPGFLDSLLRLSPEAFEAFFAYCAVPWQTRALRAVTKELIAMAADATPSHRYRAGMGLHLANAIHLGAGRAAILETLDIAAQAPPHRGVR
jgi:alkylhydroperoxidase/carboxymuconolactone decarboxylase family protein YurZ